jgi:hypothetical protein
MQDVPVQQVRIDSTGRLRIRATPSRWPGYDEIYRAALSVRWDIATGELVMLEVRGFTPSDELKQIRKAVSQEYGDQLMLSPATVYTDVPTHVVTALRALAT